jgi:hypothetical protein
MAMAPATRCRIQGAFPYLPWPEMRHAAWSLRRVAREHPRGSAHTISAAVVMTAFSVEAFCQTLGPMVLASRWTAEKRPAERWPVLKKLKEIGKAVSVSVDYGKEPWKGISELFDARDRLAHAKLDSGETDRVIDVPNGIDPVDHLYQLLDEEFQPLHDLDKLDQLAGQIDDALRPIWVGAGNSEDLFAWKGMRHWNVTAV